MAVSLQIVGEQLGGFARLAGQALIAPLQRVGIGVEVGLLLALGEAAEFFGGRR